MDLVSLLFSPSWYAAICAGLGGDGTDCVTDEDRYYRAMEHRPDWRLVLSPIALIAAFLLTGAPALA